MDNSKSTLTAVWINDVQNSGLKVVQVPTKTKSDDYKVAVKQLREGTNEEFKNAKGVKIFTSNGDLTAFQTQGAAQMVALPITTAATSLKMSPYKIEPTILPKTLHIQNSPMILSSPQRVVGIASSPCTPQSILSPLIDSSGNWTGKRLLEFADSDFLDSKRSKKGEKGGKGLRHFSMKVCEKVQKKGVTSYNEVADELVAEFSDPQRNISTGDQTFDQKNIRRRVYDALNVLMAMNIISKEKKEIKWLGLPTNSAQECQNLEQEKQKRVERIRLKTLQLQEIILQQIAFKNLVQRNKKIEKQSPPFQNSIIQLPFIIVNTDKKTVIDCSISNDKMEYVFNFDNTFEIHDDIEVLKRMGLAFNLEKGQCSSENVDKAKSMVPKALENYVIQMSQGISVQSICSSITAGPSGIKSGTGNDSSDGNDSRLQSLLLPSALATSDIMEVDGSMNIVGARGLSRQSSVTSMSDTQASRPESDSSSDDEEEYSISESEESITIDTN